MKTENANSSVVFEGINMTPDQRDVIVTLQDIHRGGIGQVTGYQPSTGYVEKPVVDIQFISAFSYERLNERKEKALNEMTFEDIQDLVTGENAKGTKLEGVALETLRDTFEQRKAQELASIQKTANGDRSDAHRQAHDRNYAKFGAVKVNFVTAKNSEGKQVPVLADNGLPTVASILLPIIEIRRSYTVEGKRKVVNSGVPVLVGNAIKKAMKGHSVNYQTLSLKDGNFERVSVAKRTILSEDVSHLPGGDELIAA